MPRAYLISRRAPSSGHFGKRASGITFSTGADGAGGFHSARNAIPPSNSRAITITNATATFPMPPTRNLGLSVYSPQSDRPD